MLQEMLLSQCNLLMRHMTTSQILYSIEVNIRAATIVGTVGGGGIDLILLGYLKAFRYHTASGVILAVAGTVIIVDRITNLIRKMVLV